MTDIHGNGASPNDQPFGHCICGHERRVHDPARLAAGELGCQGACHCPAFREPGHDVERLRQAIADHRRTVEGAGDVRVLGSESRRRASAKHDADRHLWRLLDA